jgi:hypothetical protein
MAKSSAANCWGYTSPAGNLPNFVDLETGYYGVIIADALNSAQTPILANFATLASVMAGAITEVKARVAVSSPRPRIPPGGQEHAGQHYK